MSSERSQCYSDGEFSVVNVTYDNYLAAIVGGNFSYTAQVGVCQDGVYGSVCDANWDQEDAEVICKNVGFGSNYGE